MDDKYLDIYLRDHHAASAGGVLLARRVLGSSHPLAVQIARDRAALRLVMKRLEVEPSRVKVGLVRMAARLGRLKLNGRLVRRSPLSRVLELETLLVGVRGKQALWTALQRAQIHVDDVDLGALVASAEAQGDEIDALRLGAAARAFGDA